MFVRQPQFRNSNADVQIFYGTTIGGGNARSTWNKPPGVSHVYMMLIGPGGNGDNTTGGGSGAVTVWYGAAQNVPDCLEILCYGPSGATNTEIKYRTTSTSTNQLLVGRTGSGSTGGPVMTANPFCASGFFQTTAGQNGTSSTLLADSTTFLSGGSASGTTSNYGYSNGASNRQGFFMLQPIIVGVGGSGNGRGGIGCGGGTDPSNPAGGQGMVLIASW